MREVVFANVDAFIAGMKDLGIGKIAFSETLENRPERNGESMIRVAMVNLVELIAYRDSVLYKCPLRDIDHDSLYGMLVSAGFEVTRRSRNIT